MAGRSKLPSPFEMKPYHLDRTAWALAPDSLVIDLPPPDMPPGSVCIGGHYADENFGRLRRYLEDRYGKENFYFAIDDILNVDCNGKPIGPGPRQKRFAEVYGLYEIEHWEGVARQVEWTRKALSRIEEDNKRSEKKRRAEKDDYPDICNPYGISDDLTDTVHDVWNVDPQANSTAASVGDTSTAVLNSMPTAHLRASNTQNPQYDPSQSLATILAGSRSNQTIETSPQFCSPASRIEQAQEPWDFFDISADDVAAICTPLGRQAETFTTSPPNTLGSEKYMHLGVLTQTKEHRIDHGYASNAQGVHPGIDRSPATGTFSVGPAPVAQHGQRRPAADEVPASTSNIREPRRRAMEQPQRLSISSPLDTEISRRPIFTEDIGSTPLRSQRQQHQILNTTTFMHQLIPAEVTIEYLSSQLPFYRSSMSSLLFSLLTNIIAYVLSTRRKSRSSTTNDVQSTEVDENPSYDYTNNPLDMPKHLRTAIAYFENLISLPLREIRQHFSPTILAEDPAYSMHHRLFGALYHGLCHVHRHQLVHYSPEFVAQFDRGCELRARSWHINLIEATVERVDSLRTSVIADQTGSRYFQVLEWEFDLQTMEMTKFDWDGNTVEQKALTWNAVESLVQELGLNVNE